MMLTHRIPSADSGHNCKTFAQSCLLALLIGIESGKSLLDQPADAARPVFIVYQMVCLVLLAAGRLVHSTLFTGLSTFGRAGGTLQRLCPLF